jgi:hemoglobin-like flavoprotein
MRSKLFLSYSRGDFAWEERFRKHLTTMFLVGTELFVDGNSLAAGDRWNEELQQAARESKCALLLLTPQYLERGRVARDELAMLVKEYRAGLKLLPVLVEECAWETVEPELAQVQFARWQNSTVPPREGERAKLRALKYAGDDEAIEGAVLDVCRQVGAAMGAAGQTTPGDRDRLMVALEQAFADKIDLEEAIHIGDFSVVYRGKHEGETVAVKAIPDAVRRNRMRAAFASAVASIKELLMGEDFTGAFYKILLDSRPQLKGRLEKVDQAAMLARALRDLADFRPSSQLSRFDEIAQDHAGYGITADDVKAFRTVFLAQVAEVCAKNVCSRHAWAAALDMGLGAMAKYLAAAQTQS